MDGLTGKVDREFGSLESAGLAKQTVKQGRGAAVADVLRQLIVTGEIGVGRPLVERELSAKFGVSRTPIRDAIQMLMGEGLATPTGRRKSAVVSASPDFGLELIHTRAVLEGINASLAAGRRDPKTLAQLFEILERGKAATANGTLEQLATLSAEFHDALALSSGNRVLQSIMGPLCRRAEMAFKHDTGLSAVEVWREHSLILATVLKGDAEMAAFLATLHISRAAEVQLGRQRGGANGQWAANARWLLDILRSLFDGTPTDSDSSIDSIKQQLGAIAGALAERRALRRPDQ